MTSTEEVVSTILATVDQVITHDDRVALIECLNQQIEQVQLRYTLLSAMRDSLLPDEEEELQIEECQSELPLDQPPGGQL